MNSEVPVKIDGLPKVTAIATDEETRFALSADGKVWAWGNNVVGQLGNGTKDDTGKISYPPAQIPGLTNVTAIAAGPGTGYAITADGNLWAWGDNEYGQLGNGASDDHASSATPPTRIPRLTHVVAAAAGRGTGYALTADGNVWAWGFNEYGQLGNGWKDPGNAQRPANYTPAQIRGLTHITTIAAGRETAYAITADGNVLAWGNNGTGALGQGDAAAAAANVATSGATLTESAPKQVRGLHNVVAIGAGDQSGYAIVAG